MDNSYVSTMRAADGSIVKFECHDALHSTSKLARAYARIGYPDRYVIFAERLIDVNADGEEVSQLNPTYMYVVPTTTVNTYRLTTGGEKVLIDTDVETAKVGVYIRTATIDKLFSDTNKLFRSEQIDTMAIN